MTVNDLWQWVIVERLAEGARPTGEVCFSEDDAQRRYQELNAAHPGRSFAYHMKKRVR